MKRRILVIAASVVVLALIVVVGISAQNGKAIATEQTDGNVPESCKGCPSASTCLDATAPANTTASACQSACTHDKAKCDKEKCAKCDKKEACAKSAACATKECPHNSAAGCTKSADCKKDCKKKSN
ncbi:MAG: hypothetical protein EHM93_13655 [Bacteroidales bacterium]|nr:MAG: hypothetical protein EHM93_13655 [Bacteroidales bacterium]